MANRKSFSKMVKFKNCWMTTNVSDPIIFRRSYMNEELNNICEECKKKMKVFHKI